MAHETVPADIAAAIERVKRAHLGMQLVLDRVGKASDPKDPLRSVPEAWAPFERAASEEQAARAALDAAILHHLRGVDEMKAALEAQTSGGA